MGVSLGIVSCRKAEVLIWGCSPVCEVRETSMWRGVHAVNTCSQENCPEIF